MVVAALDTPFGAARSDFLLESRPFGKHAQVKHRADTAGEFNDDKCVVEDV